MLKAAFVGLQQVATDYCYKRELAMHRARKRNDEQHRLRSGPAGPPPRAYQPGSSSRGPMGPAPPRREAPLPGCHCWNGKVCERERLGGRCRFSHLHVLGVSTLWSPPVVPNSTKFWEPRVAALGNPALRKAVTVPYQRGKYWLGSQAPAAWRAEKRKFSFVVHRVSWMGL